MTWTAGAPRGTAISGSRPAGQPAGQDGSPARPRRRAGGSRPVLSRLAQWPNWRLPVKLALVMTIPVIASLVLGSVVVSGQLGNYQSYQRANQIIQLTGSVRTVISALQAERQQAAGEPSTQPATSEQTGATIAVLRRSVAADTAAGDLDPVATAAWTTADRELAELAAVREQEQAVNADRSAEVSAYTQLIDELFAVSRVLTTNVADAQLARSAMALYDLYAAREEVRYQQAVVLAGISRGTMSVADVTSLHGSEARLASRVSDFRAVGGPADTRVFAESVSGPVLAGQSSLLGQAIDQSGGMTGEVMPGMLIRTPPATWNTANDAVAGGLTRVTDGLAAELRAAATALRSQASGTAATAAIVLIVALLIAVVAMTLVGRHLLRSIGVLRRSARDVAARQLPEAVERIRAGELVDTTVRPVPVHTTDEVGQLARAFDAVHAEAVKLAVEQANLRANYSDLFVNLSRRSQSLVQRQLRLIEQLERDEEDPDQLASLFKLDHLATRMRRNNENLMVLSGSELGRGPGQPVALADLMRAAVSEIEHYQRVVVQPPPDTQVVGYAAGDIVRLLAELMDNATAFSAPDTQVTVASHRTMRRAVLVDIVDHGIGMSDEDLAKANEQLGQPAGIEGRISRRMGLFVISQLASQHGVRVRLHGGQDIPGLRVTVTIPAELVMPEPGELLPGSDPGSPAGTANGRRPAALDAPDSGAMTVIIPRLPDASSSGVSLFAALSGPDGAAPADDPGTGGGAAANGDGELTPIFDDMLSVWFDDARPEQPGQDGPATGQHRVNAWRFAADDGWRAVDAVARVDETEYTSAGLPKRQPKARLLPGSVVSGTVAPGTVAPGAPAAERPERRGGRQLAANTTPVELPAERLRERLSGLQSGLRRGREQAARPVEARPPTDAPERSDLADTAAWSPTAEEGWRAVRAADRTDPVEFTAAGLPKRQPKARLVPGSVAGKGETASGGRDAGAVRDRLGSFQQGVAQGRGGTVTTAGERVEHGFQW